MRKLSLDLDALVVESFAAEGGAPGRGTVHGNQGWQEPVDSFGTVREPTCFACPSNTCPTGLACPTAPNTCLQTCAGNPSCALETCGLTYCFDTCDGYYCASFPSMYPAIC